MLKDNLYYFKFSRDNPEKKADYYYMFLDWNSDLDKYIKHTKEIKELSNGKPITLELFISRQRYEEIKQSLGVPKIGANSFFEVLLLSLWLWDKRKNK